MSVMKLNLCTKPRIFSICQLLVFTIILSLPFICKSQTYIINFINPRLITKDLWNVSFEYRPTTGMRSYGINNSLYFNSLEPKYNGIKISPFISFRMPGLAVNKEKVSSNFYGKLKLTTGFFNSKVKYYRYDDPVDKSVVSHYVKNNYFVGGIGASIGFQAILKNLISLDFSIGTQYVYQFVERSVTLANKTTYVYSLEGDDFHINRWYSWDPGSMVEVRIGMGLVFH